MRHVQRSLVICSVVAVRQQEIVYASVMGAYAIDVIEQGKKNRLIGYKNGRVYDVDVDEAFAMTKDINDYEYEVAGILGTRCE